MMGHVLLFCQVLVLAVFALAVVGKTRRGAFSEFAGSIRRLLPPSLAGWQRPVAAAVLSAEMAIVVLLAGPGSRAFGFALAVAVLLGFTGAIVAAMRAGARISCRCFGSASGRPMGLGHVVRNMILCLFSGIGLAVSQSSVGSVPAGEAAVTVVAAGVGAALTARFDDVLALFATDEASVG